MMTFEQILEATAYGSISHNDARIRCARAVYDAILQAATRDDVSNADAVDAQRYQWLRNRENSLETQQYNKEIINGLSCYHDVEGISELKWGVELDAAIDAAIAASAPKGDGNDR